MTQHYLDESKADDKWGLPDLETFYLEREDSPIDEYTKEPLGEGFYYWFCFPGCLPDSDATGPFKTEAKALEDARSMYLDE